MYFTNLNLSFPSHWWGVSPDKSLNPPDKEQFASMRKVSKDLEDEMSKARSLRVLLRERANQAFTRKLCHFYQFPVVENT